MRKYRASTIRKIAHSKGDGDDDDDGVGDDKEVLLLYRISGILYLSVTEIASSVMAIIGISNMFSSMQFAINPM